MSKVFSKRNLIAAISSETSIPQTTIARVFDAATKIQKKQLKAGYVVKTQNGQIKIVAKAARKGINPKTGKPITIPASKKPKFIFSKDFKRGF